MAALNRALKVLPRFNGVRRAIGSAVAPLDPPLPATPLSDQKGRSVQWVFLGCPGVGKGTYASRLSTLLGVPHIATGDLVRGELNSHGPLSQELSAIVNEGKLVSDEIILNLLSRRLKDGEAKGELGFILDGFPRTIRQAEILEEQVTEVELVVNLKLPKEALVQKCMGRRQCRECRRDFNLATINIAGENGSRRIMMDPLLPPLECMPKMVTRSDDTVHIIEERLRVYNEMTLPLEEFYRARGKLLEFHLPGGIPESWPQLLRALELDEEQQHSAAG